MAGAAEVEFDLATIKQLTQKVTTFEFENVEAPIFKWPLLLAENLPSKAYSSEYLFGINNSHLFGELKLIHSNNECNISLILTDMEKAGVTINKLYPFQFFICKITINSDCSYSAKCFYSKNAFNLYADENELNFKFTVSKVTNLTVELYQEPLAMIQYRSPYKNMVVGKIEKVKLTMGIAEHNTLLSASPRINFGSADQLIIVRFWSSKLLKKPLATASGLSATIHFLDESEWGGKKPFSFATTFTVFNKNNNGKDLVYKGFYRRDENKSHFSTLLAFYDELNPYLENDTLYYKVVFQPRS